MAENVLQNMLMIINMREEKRLEALEGPFLEFMQMRFDEYLQKIKNWGTECIDFTPLKMDAEDLVTVGKKLGFCLKPKENLKYNVSIPESAEGIQTRAQIMLDEFNASLCKKRKKQEREASMIYQSMLDAINKGDFTYKRAKEGLWEVTANIIVSNDQSRQYFDTVRELLIKDGFLDLIGLSSTGAVFKVKQE